jgi:hypothetical protein
MVSVLTHAIITKQYSILMQCSCTHTAVHVFSSLHTYVCYTLALFCLAQPVRIRVSNHKQQDKTLVLVTRVHLTKIFQYC